MEIDLCIGEVVQAEELLSGDMVLTGDCSMGIPVFVEVDKVLVDGETVIITFVGILHKTVAVKPTTEVMRLEQGIQSFRVGQRGVRTRRPIP